MNARVSQVRGLGSCLASSVRSRLIISDKNFLSEGCGTHLGEPGDCLDGVEGEGSMLTVVLPPRYPQAYLKMPPPIFFLAS